MPIAVSMASGWSDVAQPYSRCWTQHQQPGFRVLLALEGQELNRDLLDRALECCVNLTERLDVLLVRPPKAPTFLLGGLLMRLERHGIDYRLTSAEGNLGDEVLGYLRRFHGIRTLVLDRHDNLPIPTLAHLLAGDYHLISLADMGPASLNLKPTNDLASTCAKSGAASAFPYPSPSPAAASPKGAGQREARGPSAGRYGSQVHGRAGDDGERSTVPPRLHGNCRMKDQPNLNPSHGDERLNLTPLGPT